MVLSLMNSLSLTIDTRKLLSCSVVFFISAVSSLLFIYFYSRLTSLSLCNTSLQAFPSVRLDALRYHITISNLPIVLEPSYTHLCRNRKHEIHSHSLLRPVLGLLPLQDIYGWQRRDWKVLFCRAYWPRNLVFDVDMVYFVYGVLRDFAKLPES